MNKEQILKLIGNRIRFLRSSQGLSQENFANLTGLGRSYYGRIERGETNPTVITLITIAKYLKINPKEIYPDDTDLLPLIYSDDINFNT